LLPRTKQWAAFLNGNGQRRTEKRSAQVRKTVVVTPTIVVVVSSVRRNELFDEFLEIADQTGLILNGGQCGSGARDEERHEPALNLLLFDLFSDSGGDVDDVAETGSLLGKFLGVNLNHAISQTSASEEVGNKDGQECEK
jgi:hypothetical protein